MWQLEGTALGSSNRASNPPTHGPSLPVSANFLLVQQNPGHTRQEGLGHIHGQLGMLIYPSLSIWPWVKELPFPFCIIYILARV